jgi:predicted nucleotidyltransferase component of viral defense system
MLTSREELLKEAKNKGYKPEILEKVYRLLGTFQQFMSVPYLKERLVLKGGTALNLFYFNEVPRLSVDIDLNYIGQLSREKMLEERPVLISAIQQILQQNQFERYRSPSNHAGGKMIWLYDSILGQKGSLEIDINFMYRQPLWPAVFKEPQIPRYSDWHAPVLDIHELAAGKLSALFDRRVSRDLFDAHYLMTKVKFNQANLRLTFIVYLAMTAIDLSVLTPTAIQYDLTDLKNRLFPVLYQKGLPRALPALKMWVTKLIQELRDGLSVVLPLVKHEVEFIEQIRNSAQIRPELITDDIDMANKIKSHPGLMWAVKKSGDNDE